MSEKKIIAVLGATGAQGGGLVRAILEEEGGPFAVRAITRNASSEKARALRDAGAEVVEADVDDRDSLEQAFAGAHGLFAVTFFWEHFSPEKEKDQARNIAAAAKASGVEHVVWSTLDDTRTWLPVEDDRMPTLQGKYNVPHFDAKGESDAFFREAGVPTTFLLTSFYWDNFIHFGLEPKRGEDGELHLVLPMGDRKLPGIAAEDIGRVALSLFRQGEDVVGETVGIAGGHLTGKQMADAMGRALGETVHYDPVPFDVYRGFDFPGADDMGNMFQFKHDFEEAYCGARPLDRTRSLHPGLQSFESWLEKNKGRIPVQPRSRAAGT